MKVDELAWEFRRWASTFYSLHLHLLLSVSLIVKACDAQ